ncbi:transcriptional regulator, TetR family [Andreprevotia lacus DSM 23236]|jgi:AcrR family transcriptional regulator|uniref:Transcriptional regulator, TetR family n=1 Tax=Andreprevotia lacus DSM 23236 TaxID=1121001 RepID=A0A1W1XZF6_9NEIS|nr:TetR family transcriptional regulator [Andreprevotia lacus]SMC29265.1 transcriptional regulator, TetR family [Andreprevotia lacus DSM 23236]
MAESAKAQETSVRILDAAEILFVEHGFDGTSMRLITQSAAVNIAAVNYYFGSKDGLYRAVFERRAEPFARLTIANIDALERSKPAPLADDIVSAFIQSALQLGADPEYGGLTFVRLLARAYVEPHPILKESMPRRYGEVVRRYAGALQKALPHLTENEVHWRFHFLTSAMFSAFAGNNVLRLFMEQPKTNARDPQLVARMLLPFLVAGLVAPAAN